MNLEQARLNMVESQIRTWEVLDQTVLDLLLTIRREEFVPSLIQGGEAVSSSWIEPLGSQAFPQYVLLYLH